MKPHFSSSLSFHSFISPSYTLPHKCNIYIQRHLSFLYLCVILHRKMCINISEWNPSSPPPLPPHHDLLYRAKKKSKVRVHRLRLNRRNRRLNRGMRLLVKTEKIEERNLKLYLKNRSIIEENEKLRKKALLLHQENQTLFSQLQKKFPHVHDYSDDLLFTCATNA